MSNPEDKKKRGNPQAQAFKALEKSVRAAVDQIQDLRTRLDQARGESREMQELLRKFTGGEEEPTRLLSRLKNLEEERKELLARVAKGKEGVERLLARIRFLEEQG